MKNNVLLEIGVEELPARFIDDAMTQLENNMISWMKKANIEYSLITAYSTPRRLAFVIEGISEEQATITEEVRGPQVKIAKDTDENWTRAAVGFTKGQGKTVEDIYTKMDNGNEYIFVEKVTEGKRTKTILPQLKEVVDVLHFPQTMRWGTNSYRFPRPIRWLVALWNEEVIPFEIAGVSTGNTSYGHRFLGSEFEIQDPLQYESLLHSHYVIADPEKREQKIMDGIHELAEQTDFSIPVDKELLKEVRNLVEYPTVFHGEFSKDYLVLPDEVLITSMKEHQRYFPVLNKDGSALLPYFVSVRNGNESKLNNVIRGNEKVLRARLADGAFFFEEDKKQSIEFYNNKLKHVIFQEKIGTIYEKAEKVRRIAHKVLAELQVDEETFESTLRAAQVSKFDLMTNMVNEFTELQGIMGEKYAIHFGEKKSTAIAIREQYLPLYANGKLPETIQGAVISISDKLDTIIGCFSVGLIPTGSQDPHGLRRQAIGILRILNKYKWNIPVEKLIETACSIYHVHDPKVLNKVQQFFIDRATYLLQDQQIEQDVIHAVISEQIGVFHYTCDKAKLLSEKRNAGYFKDVQEALVRVMNLGKQHSDNSSVDRELFETDSEKDLYAILNEISPLFNEAESGYRSETALDQLTRLANPIHQFFDHNMVMAKDDNIKRNRLAMVTIISTMIQKYADLSLIEWKQYQSN